MSTCSVVKCNRCRRKLLREASVIKGIGPVCEKRGLKSLGTRAVEVVDTTQLTELLAALDNIKMALFRDGEAALEFEELHRQKFQDIIGKGANRVELLGVTYEILADICNQLPGSIEVADTLKALFFIVGAIEEGDVAHKRIVRLIKKVGVL
jgi:hypothetical protein